MAEIRIKRLKTSRRMRLRVFHDGSVVVTAPLRAPQRIIDDFISENQEWIQEKLAIADQEQGRLINERSLLFFHGKEYKFRLSVVKDTKGTVALNKDAILVSANSEDHITVRTLLEKWYRKAAEQHFKQRLPLLADLVNKDVSHITIRDQRTRWGSCSHRNSISLNWRLIMAPDWVSDYVIYHELAHLTHMNHSQPFWNLVAEYTPRYKEAERWLKAHQNLLRF